MINDFGRIVRAARLQAGATQYDHARYLGLQNCRKLEKIENGFELITDSVIEGTIRFFDDYGVYVSRLELREAAKKSNSGR